MRAVFMVAGQGIRRRWRSVVALAVLIGVVGAVVLATAAGARRTTSALERFHTSSRAADLELAVAGTPTRTQLRDLGRVPGVVEVAQLRAYAVVVSQIPGLQETGAAIDSKFGVTIDRERIVAGRAAHRDAPDEITLGEGLAARLDLHVGDHLDVASSTPAQIDAILGGAAEVGPPAGPRVRFRIVGIGRRPLDLSDQGVSGGLLVLTPGFARTYAGRIGVFGTQLRVRTDHGAATLDATVKAARRIFGHSLFSTRNSGTIETEGARNATDVLAVALWILAGVAFVAGIVAVGIVLTRQISAIRVDQDTLRSLGLTRRQRAALAGPATALAVGGGALLAVLGAIAASPLLPVGVARRADPDVGVHADWTVLALGLTVLVAVTLVIACVAAFRSSRSTTAVETVSRARTSTIAERAAAAGLPPPVTNGLRMALDRGQGRRAVPVRSAYVGAVLGVLGLTAVLVFASSLDRLGTTPRLYGWNWDFETTDVTSNTPCGAQTYGLARQPGIAALAEVCYENVDIDGRPFVGLAYRPVQGATITPVVLAGRAPHTAHEIALGSKTLDTLGKQLGDTVRAGVRSKGLDYRIVGRVVFPVLGQSQPLADGATFTGKGFAPLFDPNVFSRYFVGRFAPGADRAAVEKDLRAVPQLGVPSGPTVPVEIDRLRQIDWFPATLAVLLGGLALVAVGHTLVTAVRRRRRELALFKTLGFARRQVQATIAWQATTIAAAGLVVGIPAGLLVGKLAWSRVADGLGVSTAAAFPFVALLFSIPVTLVLVNLTAYLPARAAARTRPAVALRSE